MMSLQSPEILHIVSQKLKNEWVESLYQDLSQKIQSEDFEKLSKLYVKAGRGSDAIIAELANDIVGRILDILPQKFAQLTISKISLTSQNHVHMINFDIEFELEPIKPYVEFVAKSYGQHLFSWRVRFQVNSNVKLNHTEIKLNSEGKREIILGILKAEMIISLTGLPFVSMEEPKELLSKNLVLDLSGYAFSF